MYYFVFILGLLPAVLLAQAPASAPDTTVYSFADEAPRFPSPCERLDTTALAKAQCAQRVMLDYLYQRIIYPPAARAEGLQGTAVVAFIVEPNGFINRPEVLRDPGGGIGEAALASVGAMQREVRFRPAIRDSQLVRFRMVVPIRFRLEEPKPYVLLGADTVYTDLTKSAEFIGNGGDLVGYFDEQIAYPDIEQDSCSVGQMDIQLIVGADGLVSVNDIIDYNDLGIDFTTEVIDAATGSFGQWRPAEYEGRRVASAYDVAFTFAPTDPGCSYVVEDYNEAVNLMREGQQLATDSLTLGEGLARMDRAIDLFPRDGRFRILRGQVRLDNNQLAGACEDLSLAKEISLVDWYDAVLPLVCREPEE